MVIIKKRLLLSSARIILDDAELQKAFREKKYSYATGLSYSYFNFGEDVSVKKKKTILIQLESKNPESFLKGCSETTRNEVRRTFKIPELNFVVPDQNYSYILALYKDFEQRGKRSVREPDYFDKSIFAGAYREGSLIAAIICYDVFPCLRVHAIVSRRDLSDLRKYASFATRRLIFELFKFGLERQYMSLDLGGINLTEKKKSGITAFKRSFGGVEQDEYTYSYAKPIARFFLKFL